MNNFIKIGGLLLTGFLLSLIAVRAMIFVAHKYGLLVSPREDRWHRRLTALHGGVGIMVAWLPISTWILFSQAEISFLQISFIVGCISMFLIGLFDDLYTFRPAKKLVLQLIIVTGLISQGVVIDAFPWYEINLLITFIWFIGIINAVNILDNMDGLAAGVIAIGVLILLIIFLIGGGASSFVVLCLAIFLGVLLGFLVYNFNPASIFMGDSGSLFIGFFLAAISIPSLLNNNWFMKDTMLIRPWSLIPLLAPALVLAVPIFDTTLVAISRKWYGRRASLGGCDHSSHRLVGLGLSERQTVGLLYSLAGAGGLMAIYTCLFPGKSVYLLLLFVVLLGLFGAYLSKFKVYDDSVKPAKWTPLVTNLLYKRRFFEVLMDLVFVVVSYRFTFLLLFGGETSEYFLFYKTSLPLVIVVTVGAFWFFGCYQSLWHLIGIGDIGRYIWGAIVANTLLFVMVLVNQVGAVSILPTLTGHYIGLPLIYTLLLIFMVLGARISFRYFDSFFSNRSNGNKRRLKVLIYGAGSGGKIALREMMTNPRYQTKYEPLCFLDDDRQKHNRRLEGIPIVHPQSFSEYDDVDEIWVATYDIRDDQLLERIGKCTPKHQIKRMNISFCSISGKNNKYNSQSDGEKINEINKRL